MALSNEQIKKLIKSPASASQLREAVNHENRVKFHTKAVDKKERAKYYPEFIDWVKKDIALPDDKMKAFEGMCIFPLPTTSLCSAIFDTYQKIFETQDSFFDVTITQDTLKSEFMQYITDSGIFEWFKTKGFEAYKKQFNCVFVVDMAISQATERPQPYWYKVPIQKVIDIVVIDDAVQYVIFESSKDMVVHVDETRYTVWQKRDNDLFLQIDSPHILGYCPATIFASGKLYDEQEDGNAIARKIPVSDSVGDLQWLLFYSIAQRLYETYGPFPILSIPDSDCDFVDSHGQHCQGGYTAGLTNDGIAYRYECPACKKNSIIGPGTVFARPIARSKDDPSVENAAVAITPADVPSLDYITKKVDYLEWEIYANCTGSFDEQVLKEAVNEDQVRSSHEGERAMLVRVKRDFERAVTFIIKTMGRLMYGDYFELVAYTMGDRFMLESSTEILGQYQEYKKAGLPLYLVSAAKDKLVQAEYKNNTPEISRMDLLNQLEPWPDLSISECSQLMFNSKFPERFGLKCDFAKFVRKFERENGDILLWGSALSLDTKIEKIEQTLLGYAKTIEATAVELPEPGAGGNSGK